ncbi:hypothetical protein [Nonomuraea polychroma]|uniref:hypothetical protein n=1 Tax=Nonomuraea polychroma TaxID=46176 RepID=UPI000FDECA81|nr:hypothetical protein [Nonomuraea polychroma]
MGIVDILRGLVEGMACDAIEAGDVPIARLPCDHGLGLRTAAALPVQRSAQACWPRSEVVDHGPGGLDVECAAQSVAGAAAVVGYRGARGVWGGRPE